MNAHGLVSLTDYCLVHDIAPEEMEAAFIAALNAGAMVLRGSQQWVVVTDDGETLSFSAYVATLRANTETKGN